MNGEPDHPDAVAVRTVTNALVQTRKIVGDRRRALSPETFTPRNVGYLSALDELPPWREPRTRRSGRCGLSWFRRALLTYRTRSSGLSAGKSSSVRAQSINDDGAWSTSTATLRCPARPGGRHTSRATICAERRQA